VLLAVGALAALRWSTAHAFYAAGVVLSLIFLSIWRPRMCRGRQPEHGRHPLHPRDLRPAVLGPDYLKWRWWIFLARSRIPARVSVILGCYIWA